MEEKGYIYVLKDPRGGEIRYVGQTRQTAAQRLAQHKKQKIEKPVGGWVNALKGMKLEPTIEVIEEVEVSRLDEREEFYIGSFREAGFDLLNILEVGQGRKGYKPPQKVREQISASVQSYWRNLDERTKENILSGLIMDGSAWAGREHSPESREQMSASAKKRPANRKGEVNSEEHRRRISEAKKGKPLPQLQNPEAIAKVAASKRGKPRDEETKRKLSEANKGKVQPQEVKDKKRRTMLSRQARELWTEEIEAYSLL